MTVEEITDEILNAIPVRVWEVMDGMREAGKFRSKVKRQVSKAIEIEREDCAKIAENPIKIPDEPGKFDQHAWPGHPVMKAIATAIRARGEKKNGT